MKIRDELKIRASRIGNKTMIEDILSDISIEESKEYELIYILPERKGIIVLNGFGEKQILLRKDKDVQITIKTEPIEKRKKRKKSKKED